MPPPPPSPPAPLLWNVALRGVASQSSNFNSGMLAVYANDNLLDYCDSTTTSSMYVTATASAYGNWLMIGACPDSLRLCAAA